MGLKATKSFEGKGKGFHSHKHEHSINALEGWESRLKNEYKKPLSLSDAKKIHQSRTSRAQKIDENKQAKSILKTGTFRANMYVKNPNRYDISGVDTQWDVLEKEKFYTKRSFKGGINVINAKTRETIVTFETQSEADKWIKDVKKGEKQRELAIELASERQLTKTDKTEIEDLIFDKETIKTKEDLHKEIKKRIKEKQPSKQVISHIQNEATLGNLDSTLISLNRQFADKKITDSQYKIYKTEIDKRRKTLEKDEMGRVKERKKSAIAVKVFTDDIIPKLDNQTAINRMKTIFDNKLQEEKIHKRDYNTIIHHLKVRETELKQKEYDTDKEIHGEDLTTMTNKEIEQNITTLSKKPLKELRRHQELTEKQMKTAIKQKNEKAMDNLEIRREMLMASISVKEFKEKPNVWLPHINSTIDRVKSYDKLRKEVKKKEKDHIKGGLADNQPYSKYDKKQLEMGTIVEMEHTNDPKIAKEIASDHLEEIPDYYTRLDKMEKEAEKKSPNNPNHVYLGTKRVKDASPKGLSSIREVEEISDAIIDDYKKGKISKQTANGRLVLLENPIVDKAKHLEGKRKQANKAVRKRRELLKTL